MKPIRIVVLGAGYAGVRIAKGLLKRSREHISLVLIDQNNNHTLVTNLHEVASGRVSPEVLQIPLRQIFPDPTIELIQDKILGLDREKKLLTGEKGNYGYDQLIIASGANANFYGIPGAKEYTIPLDSMEEAVRIRQKLEDPATEQIIICGGGLTGVELAADLKTMQPHLSITLVEAQKSILPNLDATISQKTTQKLRKLGIEILVERRVEEVLKGGLKISGAKGKETKAADLMVWTSGTQAQWSETLPEAVNLLSNGELRMTSNSDVFLAGDAGSPEYACVENGLQSADCLLKNMERLESGEEPLAFQLKDKGQMIALGSRDGITTTRIPLNGWPAMVLKFLVDLVYVLSVGGIGAAVNYFNGHLVWPTHGKTLTGTLLSTRGQRLWLFPLRLYLGWLWLGEAVKKINGPSQFEAATSWKDYLVIGGDSWLRQGNLMVPFPWLRDVDALTGATMGGTSGPLVEKLPLWYEGLMRTIMPNPSLAMFFQTIMVWVELAVGLGLILGLLTWLSSLISFALIINFIISGVAGWQMIWILPASLALMAGAGHFIGLDALLMPKLRASLGIQRQR